jgi:hypothetical protein
MGQPQKNEDIQGNSWKVYESSYTVSSNVLAYQFDFSHPFTAKAE